MFRQEKQPNLDVVKRNVRRGSHIALVRKKGSYTHHMLVTEVYNDAIKVIEYGSPTYFKSLASAALVKYSGIIQEKQISFDELFGPNASDVFLVYCDDYPETDKDRNSAIQRAKSRLGEKRYCLTCNNCEHFVTWALTGTPISMQWRNASAFCRFKADFLTTPVSEVFWDILLLAQKYISNIEVFSQCLSNLKEKCLKYLPNGVDFNKLRARISSGRKLDVLPAILFLVFRILETLDLWRKKLISTEDMLRELFKISMSYFVNLALNACIPASIPFFIQVLVKPGITAMVSSAAGFVFDIGHMILSNLLPRIETLSLQLLIQSGAN